MESTNKVLTTENKRLESDLSKATAAAAKSEQVFRIGQAAGFHGEKEHNRNY